MNFLRVFSKFVWIILALASACVMIEDYAPQKSSPTGLIATPAAYYSTPKARYLGANYKDNLDRMVGSITANPRTANLQFANNLSSVGGIGFFTHSATKTPDERYLEVVLATTESFDGRNDHSEKIHRLFSLYGSELLKIMSADQDLYQDREFSGYGLNLSWQNVGADPAKNRAAFERAILYFPKVRARSFVRQELSQNEFLADAVIFSVTENGPLRLVSYQPQAARSETVSSISERNLGAPGGAQTVARRVESAPLVSEGNQKAEKQESTQVAGTSTSPKSTISPVQSQDPGVQTAKVKAPVATVATPEPVTAAPGRAEGPRDATAGRTAVDQVSSLGSNPVEAASRTRPLALSAPRALAGYIIQLAFNEKEKAQRWAESMEKRGYAVSVTETGSDGPLRVRLGNFAVRDEAERQLRAFKQEGLSGIVINLPQSFQPVARASAP